MPGLNKWSYSWLKAYSVALFWVTWYCSSVRVRLSSASLGFLYVAASKPLPCGAALVLPGSGSSALRMSMWQ
ncbi:hypothetical protein [Neisseria gonorrhoeae]|uniref:hypothetical protein n=1 Tax=Neisseria gonorrhoeae TaxID=485 RepID=UPI00272AA4A2|nr:hypothetical protein [Neisseria gonorrhoeae]WLF14431.1 hypothetical protein Q6379_09600 [Neisseria gonorrhoeae]